MYMHTEMLFASSFKQDKTYVLIEVPSNKKLIYDKEIVIKCSMYMHIERER